MRNINSLNVVEKLLVASYKLEKKGKSSFSAEDIVVSAWKNFPDTFGLRGYHDENGKLKYPDSNRVFAEIMGSKPIRKRGFLIKIGTKKYKLTESGRQMAKLIMDRADKKRIEKAGFSRDVEIKLRSLLESRAIRKLKENRESDITFFDACNFWNISPRSSSIEMEGKLENLMKILTSARRLIGNKIVTFEHSGEVFSSKEIDLLVDLHNTLLKKFKNELDIIRKRKDEHR